MEKLSKLISDYQLDLENEKQVHIIDEKQLVDDLEKLKNPFKSPQNTTTSLSKNSSSQKSIYKTNQTKNPNLTQNDNKAIDDKELEIVNQLKLHCMERTECLLQQSTKVLQECSPKESGKSLHKLGLVYFDKSSCDVDLKNRMRNLIKSAALMNAAIVRQTNNCKEIGKDLQKLCKHVLNISNASNKHADLIDKALEVQKSIVQMRDETNKQLKRISTISLKKVDQKFKTILEGEKIFAMENLQNQITYDYKNILADVAKYCGNIMGEPPCKFAIAGMGSLSRKEITPYSDFEHLILLAKKLSNDNDLNYFRWFSVVFHIVIINLQETILPSVAISSLNDTTKPDGDWFYDSITVRGISFDGMMPHASKFPLEGLIKSVQEMGEYLKCDKSLKNDYHLREMLTSTCFVYGDEKVFGKFQDLVADFVTNQEKSAIVKFVKKQISYDLYKFATKSNVLQVQSHKAFNVKCVIYRCTTLFITALRQLNKIYLKSDSSSFKIIEELASKNVITDFEKQKLLFAVALACEIRLQWYMTNKHQQNNVKGLNKLVDLVGTHNIVSYFQIAYALQCDISKRLNLKKVYFYSNLRLFNVSLSCCFNNDKQLVAQLKKTELLEQTNEERLYNFDECLKYLENDKEKPDAKEKSPDALTLLQKLADDLYESKCFDDAYEFYKKCLEKLKKKETKILNHILSSKIIKHCNHRMGVCLLYLDKHQEAFHSSRIALIKRIKSSLNINLDLDVAITMSRFGCCLMIMELYTKALMYLKCSLTIKMNFSQDIESDNMVADALYEIGICLTNRQEFNEAMKYFNKALQIQINLSKNEEIERGAAYVLLKIGCCLTSMNDHDQAMLFLRKALEIEENTSRNIEADQDIASVQHEIGCCMLSMGKLDKAKLWLEKALDIKVKISLDVDCDKSIGMTLEKIDACLQNENKTKICFDDLHVSTAAGDIKEPNQASTPSLDGNHLSIRQNIPFQKSPTLGPYC